MLGAAALTQAGSSGGLSAGRLPPWQAGPAHSCGRHGSDVKPGRLSPGKPVGGRPRGWARAAVRGPGEAPVPPGPGAGGVPEAPSGLDCPVTPTGPDHNSHVSVNHHSPTELTKSSQNFR